MNIRLSREHEMKTVYSFFLRLSLSSHNLYLFILLILLLKKKNRYFYIIFAFIAKDIFIIKHTGNTTTENLFRWFYQLSKFFIMCIIIWMNAREKKMIQSHHYLRREIPFSSYIPFACYCALFLRFCGLLERYFPTGLR